MNLNKVVAHYFSDIENLTIDKFGNGLIHGTYVVSKENKPAFILQQINTEVFKTPDAIASNLEYLSNFLTSHNQDVFFPVAQKTLTGLHYAIEDNTYFRLTPFVLGTHSVDACSTVEEAYEAAFQFGKFSSSFNKFDTTLLKPTIPDFHNLEFRWEQFLDALQFGNKERIAFASAEITLIQQNYSIVETYQKIIQSSDFIQRVTHHDTKINNVLFNESNKGVCVIDLDTVMSGYFISDLGDMYRTYLASASEEITDFDSIQARASFYDAIIEGYLESMKDQMTVVEIKNLAYAGEFMIYMQALRFLTDFLNNDSYYGIRYELNNYNRAKNQLVLLEQYRIVAH